MRYLVIAGTKGHKDESYAHFFTLSKEAMTHS